MALLHYLLDCEMERPRRIDCGSYRRWCHLTAAARDLGSCFKSDKDEFEVNLDVQHFNLEGIRVKTAVGYIVVEGKPEDKRHLRGFIPRLFGANNTSNCLFCGSAITSSCGTSSGFNFGAGTSSGGLFNKPTTSGLFGNNQNNTSFGAKPTGGFGTQQATGTAYVKFNPVEGTEEVFKIGSTENVNVKYQCITFIKEVKSLEELRLEDYAAGRKGAQGAPPVFGGFQQTENKPLSGTPSTGLFGATTTQASASSTNTSTFGFGTNTQNQPSTGLFGAKPATSGFGAPDSSAFGGFGGLRILYSNHGPPVTMVAVKYPKRREIKKLNKQR